MPDPNEVTRAEVDRDAAPEAGEERMYAACVFLPTHDGEVPPVEGFLIEDRGVAVVRRVDAPGLADLDALWRG